MRKENVDRIERAVVVAILALLVCAIVIAFPFHAWSEEEITEQEPTPSPSSSPSPSPSASPAVFSPDAPIPASDWIDQWTGRDWEHEA